MEEKRKFTVKDALATVGNFFISLFKGDLVLKLHADKYFVHILYTFARALNSFVEQQGGAEAPAAE